MGPADITRLRTERAVRSQDSFCTLTRSVQRVRDVASPGCAARAGIACKNCPGSVLHAPYSRTRAHLLEEVLPIEGGTGILLAARDVVVPQDAAERRELLWRELVGPHAAIRASRSLGREQRQDLAQLRRELDERLVLLGGQVVHLVLDPMDLAADPLGPRRPRDETRRPHPGLRHPFRNAELRPDLVAFVPSVQRRIL